MEIRVQGRRQRRDYMWFRKASPRRQAIREDVAEIESLAPADRKQTGHVFAIAAVFLLVALAIQFWPRDPLPYRVGERALTDLRAPVAFTMVNAQKAEELRDATRKYSPSVLVADHTAAEAIYGQLNNLRYNVEGVRSVAEAPATVKEHFPGLTDDSLRRIQALNTSVFEADARALVGQQLATIPIISGEDAAAIQERHVTQVALAPSNALPESITVLEMDSVYPIGGADEAQQMRLRQAIQESFPEGVTEVIASYFAGVKQPTFRFSAALTKDFAERRVAHMAPVGMSLSKDEVIVPRGEVISELAYQMLMEARSQLEKDVAATHPWAPWAAALGRALIVGILTVAAALYVVRMNDVSRTPKQGWIVCGLMLLTLVPARFIVSYWPQSTYLVGMLPTLLTAVILTIAYNQRFALGLSAFHALLVTVTLGQGLDFFFPLVAGAATFCFSLKEIRTLPRLFQVGFFYARAGDIRVGAGARFCADDQLWDVRAEQPGDERGGGRGGGADCSGGVPVLAAFYRADFQRDDVDDDAGMVRCEQAAVEAAGAGGVGDV